MGKGVLVFVEQRDGAIKRAALEALSEGRRIADGLGAGLTALIAGGAVEALAEETARFGPDRILLSESPLLESYSGEGYTEALGAAVEETGADVVLLAATMMGRDLAPRVAARLGAGLASDCVELAVREGALIAKRPVYSGKAIATVAFGGLAMATLRPNVFRAEERPAGACPVEKRGVAIPGEKIRARVVSTERAERREIDVAEASIIVSGGRGLKEAGNFSLVRELAEALGGAVGASRAVVDSGWIEHKHQVGQTGKVVSPVLYIACGISGAIQHLAGMSTSKVIVAINKDPEAPIFKIADYGIVGDLFEVLPLLTREVKQIRGEG